MGTGVVPFTAKNQFPRGNSNNAFNNINNNDQELLNKNPKPDTKHETSPSADKPARLVQEFEKGLIPKGWGKNLKKD